MVFTLVRLRRSPGFGFLIWWLVADLIGWNVCVDGCYFSGAGFVCCGSDISFVVGFKVGGFFMVVCFVFSCCFIGFLFVLFGWLGFRLVGIVWRLRGCFGF